MNESEEKDKTKNLTRTWFLFFLKLFLNFEFFFWIFGTGRIDKLLTARRPKHNNNGEMGISHKKEQQQGSSSENRKREREVKSISTADGDGSNFSLIPIHKPIHSRLQAKKRLLELAGTSWWPGGRTEKPRNMKVRMTSARSTLSFDKAKMTWLHCSSSSAYSSSATNPSLDPVWTRRDGTSKYRRPRHKTPSQRQSRVAVNPKTKASRVGCCRDALINSSPCIGLNQKK